MIQALRFENGNTLLIISPCFLRKSALSID